jgi:hypothetical protein
MSRNALLILLASNLFLAACGAPATSPTTPSGSDGTAPSTTTAAKTTTAPPSPLENPSVGTTTFTVYEGYMSPPQQPGEETDAPKLLEKATGLQSTAPSTPREQRKSLGHGRIRFNRNLSRAYVDVEIEGVKPEDIMMFHVHCGPPGVLGPIIVDFGEFGDLSKNFVNGKLSVELSNKNITFIKDMPHGLKPALPESCPAELGFLPTQTMTIAGMEYLARKGVLYFNLHTKAHTFYGEMRGQIYGVKE